jgi:hypothetical protein
MTLGLKDAVLAEVSEEATAITPLSVNLQGYGPHASSMTTPLRAEPRTGTEW